MVTKEQAIAKALKEKQNEGIRVKREKMKNKIIFIGVGQCGCNIAVEMYDRGYKALFVNTSDIDLHGLRVDDKFIVKIEDADGCSGNREKAKEIYAADKANGGKILNDIDAKIKEFGNAEHIIFCFSESGGTGSGFGPLLAQDFGKKYDPDRSDEVRELTDEYSDKYVGIVTAVPTSDKYTSEQHRINAIECWKDIASIRNWVRSIFIIDNNNMEDEKSGNEAFGEFMQAFLISTAPDGERIIDVDEIGTMLKTRGYAYITKAYKTDGKEDGGYRILDEKSNIFVNAGSDTAVIGFSIGDKNDFDMDHIEKRFGDAPKKFFGYNETEDTYIYAFGQELPGSRWMQLQDEVKKQREKREKESKSSVIDYSKIEIDTKSIYKDEAPKNVEEVALDDILAGITVTKSARRRR